MRAFPHPALISAERQWDRARADRRGRGEAGGAPRGAASRRRARGRRRAARGEDALWMARATEYDAIVLDVMLPGVDGFEVCRQLRASRRLGARADAHRPRRGRRPGRRPRRGRRRLPDQAVLVRRAAGAAPRARPPRARGSGRRCSRSAISASTRRHGRSGAARRRSSSRRRSSRCWRRSCAGRDACSRRYDLLEHAWDYGLRAPLERRRRLRPLPPREGRPPVRARRRSRRSAAPATGCARTAARESPVRSGCG